METWVFDLFNVIPGCNQSQLQDTILIIRKIVRLPLTEITSSPTSQFPKLFMSYSQYSIINYYLILISILTINDVSIKD